MENLHDNTMNMTEMHICHMCSNCLANLPMYFSVV